MSTETTTKANSTYPPRVRLAALAFIVFAVVISLIPWRVSAQQERQQVFAGTVLVGGRAPENGSILSAWTGSRRLGEVKVRQGKFRIVIPQRDDISLAGREVSFRLDGRKLRGAGIWNGGRTTDLELRISRNNYLNPQAVQNPAPAPTSLPDQSFVGVEPKVCDTLRVDGVLLGAIHRLGEYDGQGKIEADGRDRTQSNPSEIRATLRQIGCRLVGELKITSKSLSGAGAFHGTVDGNFVRLTVPGEKNGAIASVNFSGIIDGNRVSGQYFSPRTKEIGQWILTTQNAAPNVLANWTRSIERSAPSVLSELRSQLGGQADKATPDQVRNTDRTESARDSRIVQPAVATAEKQPSPSKTESEPAKTAPTEEQKKRGFFFNALSGESNSLDQSLDPTTLAVIGILITLVATAVQLFRGN